MLLKIIQDSSSAEVVKSVHIFTWDNWQGATNTLTVWYPPPPVYFCIFFFLSKNRKPPDTHFTLLYLVNMIQELKTKKSWLSHRCGCVGSGWVGVGLRCLSNANRFTHLARNSTNPVSKGWVKIATPIIFWGFSFLLPPHFLFRLRQRPAPKEEVNMADKIHAAERFKMFSIKKKKKKEQQ